MPIFATMVVTVFGALAGFLAKMFAVRTAIKLAAIAGIAAAGTAFVSAFNGIVAPLASAVFNTEYGQFIGLVFPPIAGTCIAAITSMVLICAAYRFQVRSIESLGNL